MKNQKLIYLIFVFSIFISRLVSGQTIEMSMVPDSVSTFKLDYSQLLENDDLGIFSGNYSLEINKAINKKIGVLAEIPILSFNYKTSTNKLSVGNLFLGIQLKTSNIDKIKSAFNVGIYLPTTIDLSLYSVWYEYGLRTNIFEFPKYLEKTTTIHVGGNSFYFLSNRLRIGFELGSNLMISNSGNNAERDLLAKYGLSLMYPKDKGISVQLELLGVAILTQEGNFGEKTIHTYALGLGYNWDRVGIGVYYRNYFDNINIDGFKGIFGTQLYLFSSKNRDRKRAFSKSEIY